MTPDQVLADVAATVSCAAGPTQRNPSRPCPRSRSLSPRTRWAQGFRQCGYSCAPESDVIRVAREFRARDLPCDVLVDLRFDSAAQAAPALRRRGDIRLSVLGGANAGRA